MQFNVLYESENLFVSSLHHSFESETFRFRFFYEKRGLTYIWGGGEVKCEKLNSRKSQGNLRKLYLNEMDF